MSDDDETDDENFDLVESGYPPRQAPGLAPPRLRKPLASEELDLLDLAVLAALGAFEKGQRQSMAARIVEAGKRSTAYRHDGMIRTIIALATAWRNGSEGDRELVAVRNEVSGHFRRRYDKRRAGNAE